MATETVHFRIGEDMGILLAQIAQEHLTERNNPIQALKTITESLHGCPTDLAVLILKGEIVLLVDVDAQQVIPTERTPALDKIYPKIDPVYFLESRARNIKKHGGYIVDGLKALQTQIAKDKGYFDISFKYEDVFKFIAGDNEALLEELRDNREIDGMSSLFEATKRFTEETLKTLSTMDWIVQTFDEFKDSKTYTNSCVWRGDVTDILDDIATHLNKTLKLDFSLEAPEDNVQKYIDSAREIDEILSKDIVPVDILDNWSAGWLAPNGDYYALNGEIANMLHNQIADALVVADVITTQDEDTIRNPDVWLEQNGWVKIHGNQINFAGCLNTRIGKRNVQMTSEQIQKIYLYGQKCWNGALKVGWKMQPMSAVRFRDSMSANPDALNKDYFEF